MWLVQNVVVRDCPMSILVYRPGLLPGRSSVISEELQAGGNSICLYLTGMLLRPSPPPPRRPPVIHIFRRFQHSLSAVIRDIYLGGFSFNTHNRHILNSVLYQYKAGDPCSANKTRLSPEMLFQSFSEVVPIKLWVLEKREFWNTALHIFSLPEISGSVKSKIFTINCFVVSRHCVLHNFKAVIYPAYRFIV